MLSLEVRFVLLICFCLRCFSQMDCRYVYNGVSAYPLDECMSDTNYDVFSNGFPITTSRKYTCNTQNTAIIREEYDDPYCSILNESSTVDSSEIDFNCQSSTTCNFATFRYWMLSECDSASSINLNAIVVSQAIKLVVEDSCFSTENGIESTKATCDSTSVTRSRYNDNECRELFKNTDNSLILKNNECVSYGSTGYYSYSEIQHCDLTDSSPYTPYQDYLSSLDCRFVFDSITLGGPVPLDECVDYQDSGLLSYYFFCNANNDGIIRREYDANGCNGSYVDTGFSLKGKGGPVFNCVSSNKCPMTKARYYSWSGQCSDGLSGANEGEFAFVLAPNGDECFSDGDIGVKITCNNDRITLSQYNDHECKDITYDTDRSLLFLNEECSVHNIAETNYILYSEISQCDIISSNISTPTITTTTISTTKIFGNIDSSSQYSLITIFIFLTLIFY